MNTLEIIRMLIKAGWIEELNDRTAVLAARDLDTWLKIDSDHSVLLWGSE